jgi:hypothetical protein
MSTLRIIISSEIIKAYATSYSRLDSRRSGEMDESVGA